MSDKYSLKRDDFVSSIATSIGSYRKSSDFTDITLVSNDEQFFPAHKLILASASDFFKEIFQKLIQKNSYFFLSNINAVEMQYVLDFIYLGEVQIPEIFVQDFLALSNLLKIYNLDPDASNEASKPQESNMLMKDYHAKKNEPDVEQQEIDEYGHEKINENQDSPDENLFPVKSEAFNPNVPPRSEEFIKKIKSFIRKIGNSFECTLCGKTARYLGNLKLHVETHIEGLAFDCKLCKETFKTRHSYYQHNKIHRPL